MIEIYAKRSLPYTSAMQDATWCL